MSWKLMNFRTLRFIGIWNDDCCSISWKCEIPSTFLGKVSWKLTQKCPGKSWKLTQKCPGKSWKLIKKCPGNSWKLTQKCPGNQFKNVLESPRNDLRHLSGIPVMLELIALD